MKWSVCALRYCLSETMSKVSGLDLDLSPPFGGGRFQAGCSDALLKGSDVVPRATVEDVVEAVALEDDVGLRAAATAEAEDDDRLFAFELVEFLFDLIEGDIDSSGDTARSKFAGRADIYQECTVLDGLYEGLIIRTREETFDEFEHNNYDVL